MTAVSTLRSAGVATCEAPVAALYGALHDHLTGLLSPGAWWAATSARVAAGGAGPVLLVDLDRLKWWNDRHGHPVGDKVLQGVASALSAELRHVDLVGRVGGDELIVMLGGRHDDLAALAGVGERLRRCVGDLRRELPEGPAGPGVGPTLSIGGALCSPGTSALDEVIAMAARALYRVKHNGRDGVCIAGIDGREMFRGAELSSTGRSVRPVPQSERPVGLLPELIGRATS